MDIYSAVDVAGLLRSPLCKFGTENCNISIVKGNYGRSRMYVTIPQTIAGETKKYTYDMRSIIESIQELNRRTATFNCTVTFTTANPEHGLPSKTDDDQLSPLS